MRSVRRSARLFRAAVVAGSLGLVVAGCSSASPSATSAGPGATDAPSGASTSNGTTGTTGAGAAGTTPVPSATRPGMVFPGQDWQTADPASEGFDQAGLDKLAAAAKAGQSNCLLVARDGKIVEEQYWNGASADKAQEVFSATKSYTSALVGIAQDEGKLSIDDSASKYIPAWKGTPAEQVTVKNLLSNDSGRHWDYATDYSKMAVQAPDKTQFAIDLPQDHAPGTVWVYNNSAIQTLSAVLESAVGGDPAQFAKEKLLDPIGMSDSEMTHDKAGNMLTFMGLHSTCRDMARYGQLLLNHGNWDGKQVVSSAYLADATGQPSQSLNAAYGYLFWLNQKGKLAGVVSPTDAQQEAAQPDGQMVPGAPKDVYWALGLGDQMITVFPDTGVVAVRLGPAQPPKDGTRFSTSQITMGTQEALTHP
jgi:CubicO group peptidase (beta-lactamase class C family)